MLNLIITLAIIGALVGLIFSRKGKESEGFFSGAKKGAKVGCLISIIAIVVIVAIILGMSVAGV